MTDNRALYHGGGSDKLRYAVYCGKQIPSFQNAVINGKIKPYELVSKTKCCYNNYICLVGT